MRAVSTSHPATMSTFGCLMKFRQSLSPLPPVPMQACARRELRFCPRTIDGKPMLAICEVDKPISVATVEIAEDYISYKRDGE